MCVIAIDYVCPFIDYMHFICTLFLGSSKGAFKIKCVIITYIHSSDTNLLQMGMGLCAEGIVGHEEQ